MFMTPLLATNTAASPNAMAASMLLANGIGTDSNIYATATLTPSPGKLVLLATMNDNSAAGTALGPSSVAGCGLTFTKLRDVTQETQWGSLSLWYACSLSATTGTIILTHAVTKESCAWIVMEFDADCVPGDNGLSGIVQHVGVSTGADNPATRVEAQLAAFAKASNGTLIVGSQSNGSATNSVATDAMTELADITVDPMAAWMNHMCAYYKASINTVPAYVNSSGVSFNAWGAIALEIKSKDTSGVIHDVAGTFACSVSIPAAAAQRVFDMSGGMAVTTGMPASSPLTIKDLLANFSTTVTFAGTADFADEISGSYAVTAIFTGQTSIIRDVKSTLAVSSAFGGAIGLTRPLAGSFAINAAFTGSPTYGLASDNGGSFAVSAAFAGTLQRMVHISSSIAVSVGIFGGVEALLPLSGTLFIDSMWFGEAQVSHNHPLEGLLNISTVLHGTVDVGPLWRDAPSETSPWVDAITGEQIWVDDTTSPIEWSGI